MHDRPGHGRQSTAVLVRKLAPTAHLGRPSPQGYRGRVARVTPGISSVTKQNTRTRLLPTARQTWTSSRPTPCPATRRLRGPRRPVARRVLRPCVGGPARLRRRRGGPAGSPRPAAGTGGRAKACTRPRRPAPPHPDQGSVPGRVGGRADVRRRHGHDEPHHAAGAAAPPGLVGGRRCGRTDAPRAAGAVPAGRPVRAEPRRGLATVGSGVRALHRRGRPRAPLRPGDRHLCDPGYDLGVPVPCRT